MSKQDVKKAIRIELAKLAVVLPKTYREVVVYRGEFGQAD